MNAYMYTVCQVNGSIENTSGQTKLKMICVCKNHCKFARLIFYLQFVEIIQACKDEPVLTEINLSLQN